MSTYANVLLETSKEFPDFQIVFKSKSSLMKTIATLLKPLCPTFMTDFITTVGMTVYVPDAWTMYKDVQRAEILRHERVHMRQNKKYGALLFAFLYLFVAFPLYFATYRAMFEREAYEESMRAYAEYYGPAILLNPEVRSDFVGYFTGSNYGWMWPNKAAVEKWYDQVVSKIQDEVSK